MFKRLIRVIKSWFGKLIETASDPKTILEQNIRELNDQVPKMNENIATVKGNKIMLEKEVKNLKNEINDLEAKIKSAIEADRDDIAENYALKLQNKKENLKTSKEQLEFAENAYEKALDVKKAFMREKDKKIKKAKEALRANERAEWQGEIADTLEQFEVGGIDHTHDEMVNKVNQETAKNEARMEMALDSIDTEAMEIEANADKIQASELVEQFKNDMKRGNISIDEKDVEEEQKTIGTNTNKVKQISN